MLEQSGLYYPYIHVRDDNWLKAAALYWKRLDRIVPLDYPTHDTRTAAVLTGELGFLHERRPGQVAVETSKLFLNLLEERGEELVRDMRVQPSLVELERRGGRPQDGGISDQGTIGYIFAEKLSPQLIEAMATAGLAFGASEELRGQMRTSMAVGSAHWIGMDSRLAATYMTVLARLTAHRFDLNPVTDVRKAHLAMSGDSMDSIAQALVGTPSSAPRPPNLDLRQRVTTLAIQSVVPRGLGRVDVDRIVAFRKQHESELSAFQTAIAAAVEEVAMLPPDVDERVLRDRIAEVTDVHLLGPKKELESSLSLFGLKPTTSAMTFQLPLSASGGAALGVATTPIVGTAIAAAAVSLAFAGTEAVRRRELRASNGAANYLLELQRGLAPSGAVRRHLRSIIGR